MPYTITSMERYNYKICTPTSNFPRLVVERSEASPDKQIGFLQISTSTPNMRIGGTDGREFRLMQCLFSPRNFPSAKYEPVFQTHERLFEAIRVSADTLNKRLVSRESAENEMSAIVEKSLRDLREGEAGGHLTFVSEGGRVRMEIIRAQRDKVLAGLPRTIACSGESEGN